MSAAPRSTADALVCDFDDTLMATRLERQRVLCETLGCFGAIVTPTDLDRHWGKPFRELIRSVADSLDYDAFYLEYGRQLRLHPPRPNPGAMELLRRSALKNVPVLVLSSGSHDLVESDLEAADAMQFIHSLWCHEDVEYQKPDPRTILPLLNTVQAEYGVSPRDILYIGDGVADWKVASGMGLRFVGVLTGLTQVNDFLASGVPHKAIFETIAAAMSAGAIFGSDDEE